MAKNNILLETGTNEFEVVEFILEYKQNKTGNMVQQSFGINVAKIREIIRMPSFTKMPNLPEVICGVFRLRGAIYPAVDLRNFLYGQKNDDPSCKMVIAEFNQLKVGFIVNNVARIHRVSWSQIISPDSIQEFTADKSSIIGLLRIDGRSILMLDVEKIVADMDPNSAIEEFKDTTEKFIDHPIAITAEDSTIIRKMISDRLDSAGFEIQSHKDGLACWNTLEELAKKAEEENIPVTSLCNVVISDIEMPKMDGYTLTKNIKSHPKLKKIPVILFSSLITNDLHHKGKAVGADAQLTKPQIGELLDVIRELLKNNNQTIK